MNLKHLALAAAMLLTIPSGVVAAEHLKSLNPADFDKSTPAGSDFYMHVNKGWMDANPLTKHCSRFAVGQPSARYCGF